MIYFVAANIYDMYTSKEILVSVFAIENSLYLKKEIGADAAFIQFKSIQEQIVPFAMYIHFQI